jgi:hypothetical protein
MVFISKDGETFSKCRIVKIQNEKDLQDLLRKLLEENVEIVIPVDKEKEHSKFVYLTREYGIPSGSIDLLGIDDDGYIYIIETKLYRSSERRKALAQVIEYASVLWSEYSYNPDVFIKKLKEKEPNITFEKQISESTIKESVRDGSFRLIIAMDRVDEPTEKMINFLNEMSEFDVYGLSLEVYESDDGFKVVIPKLYPQSPPEPIVSKPRRWNWISFLEDARERIPEHIKTIEEIYRFSEEITRGKGGLRWGSGKNFGSFRIYIDNLFDGKSIISVSSNGLLTICFANLYPQEPLDETSKNIVEIVDRFAEQLYNTGLLKEKISHENYREAGKQYPSLRAEQWVNKISELKGIVKELIDNMENLIAENI